MSKELNEAIDRGINYLRMDQGRSGRNEHLICMLAAMRPDEEDCPHEWIITKADISSGLCFQRCLLCKKERTIKFNAMNVSIPGTAQQDVTPKTPKSFVRCEEDDTVRISRKVAKEWLDADKDDVRKFCFMWGEVHRALGEKEGGK